MNTNKLLLKLGPKIIIQQVVENILASGVSGVTIVVGHMKEELVENLAGYSVNFVENPSYSEGMSTSLKAGIQKIINDEKDAVMIFNGDMPFIKTSTIDSIIATYEKSKAVIIAPFYGGKRGHPVLFDRKLFPELLGIFGDKGAREILQKHLHQVVFFNVDDPGIHQDIDCSDDYEKVIKDYRM